MKQQFIAGMAVLSMFIISCSKSSEDTVGGGNPPPGGNTCDTVNMKYAANVVPILQANCYSCHGTNTNSGSAGIILEGYSNISTRAKNGTLVGVITHASGFPAMPKDMPKLSTCNINKIISWVNRGALDN
jgi:hypothetical protein